MLSFLGKNECLRVFPDAPNQAVPPEIRHGDIKTLEPWYKAQNRAGGGVFFSVNETDGVGARTENITRVRAFYTDIDGLPTETEKAEKLLDLIQARLPPSAIVSTRNGLHCYWRIEPTAPNDLQDYSLTNLGIAGHFGGDESVKDLARVLRLPGTYHMKQPDNPYLIEVLHDRPVFYTEKQLRAAYHPPRKSYRPKREYSRRVDKPEIWGMITDDLAAWNPQPGQRNLAMLLASGVAIKFGVPKDDCFHDLLPIVESWGINRDEYGELRRVTNWAYGKGNPTSVAALRNLGVDIRRLPRPNAT